MKRAIIRSAVCCFLLGGCTAQDAANLLSGATTVCKDEALGVTVVSASDPKIVGNNSKTLGEIAGACGAVNAIPPPQTTNAMVPAK